MTPSACRRSLAALLGLAVAAALLVLSASPAAAHATMVSTTPTKSSVLNTAPDEVVIEFSEPVSAVAADTGVTAPDGSKAHASPATTEQRQLRYELRDDLPDGTYVVSYRVISADGHPVPGGFTFSIGEKSTVPEAAEAGSSSDPLVATLVYVNRFGGYAGLALTLGSSLLLFWGSNVSRRGAVRLTMTGLSLVAATAVLGLYLQVPYTVGTGLFEVTGTDVGSVLGSRFGGASLTRMLLVLAGLPMLKHALAAAPGRSMRWVLGLAGTALAATWPFAGHATTSPAPALTIATDTIHIGAATVWVGGLCTLAFFLVKTARTREAEAFLPTWSRWATWIVASLAIAGLAQALIHIGTLEGLVSTTYGGLVMAKAGLFAVLLITAALARRAVRGIGAREVVTTVRRLIATELAAGTVVLGLSTVLVQAVPAQGAVSTDPETGPQTFTKTMETDKFTVQFELEPATIGTNQAHLYVFEPDGVTELEPREWAASFGRPDEGISLVDFELSQLSPNHSTGEVEIPRQGEWSFEITIRVSKFERDTVTAVVPIE